MQFPFQIKAVNLCDELNCLRFLLSNSIHKLSVYFSPSHLEHTHRLPPTEAHVVFGATLSRWGNRCNLTTHHTRNYWQNTNMYQVFVCLYLQA